MLNHNEAASTLKYTHYLALGDSISIDLYPSLDTDNTPNAPVGAASLLAKQIRAAHNPDLRFANLTQDGATIKAIRARQLPHTHAYRGLGDRLLITLTAGGNDISFAAMNHQGDQDAFMTRVMPRIAGDWLALVTDLTTLFAGATIVVNTHYDPTEGTGTFGGHAVAGAWEDIVEQYTPGRVYLSDCVRGWVPGLEERAVVLADLQQRFRGHGVTASEEDRWHWREFMIEPNAEGARQIAALWMQAIQPANREPFGLTPGGLRQAPTI